jgi:hypothetical protein
MTESSVTSDKFINSAGIATIRPVSIVENHGLRNRGWIDENIFGSRPSRLIRHPKARLAELEDEKHGRYRNDRGHRDDARLPTEC